MAVEIRLVMRCFNNMVAVFDERGEQIPAYQGHYDDVRDKILADAPKGCRFEAYGVGLVEVGRNEW